MPIIKSARKRVKVAAKASARNSKTKRNMRETLKAFTKSLSGGSAKQIAEAERAAVSAIDKAAKAAVIHKNKAARKKAQISRQAKAGGARVTPATNTPIKKAPAKKPVTKKDPAKPKTVTKKTTIKKPASKK